MSKDNDFVANLLAWIIGVGAIIGVVTLILLLAMLFWGCIFSIFGYFFPGVLQGLLPSPLNTYEDFTLGTMFAFVVFACKSLFGRNVTVAKS